ncbi:MAG: insulinase family protein [Deltaproteobacteria bacterium]|nr:insulinase family protein [Deltaproteobacteria bacterium]
MKRLFLVLVIFISFPRSAVAFDLQSRLIEHTLSNGMKWLIVQRRTAPVFSGAVIVRVGGADETTGKTGLAHMFEHMAFKGSRLISKPNEVWEVMLRNGAVGLNAFTNKDMTVYHASLPANRFALWSFVASQMISDLTYRDFDIERSVVAEERRSSAENDPDGRLIEELLQTAYVDGVYRWSTIGLKEDIVGLTVDDARAFHRQHYGAANMIGVVVGDVDVSTVITNVEKHFGSIPAGSRTRNPLPGTTAGGIQRRVKINAEPAVIMAFHKPTYPDPRQAVFDVLTTLLCDGQSSRLVRRLVVEERLARDISCAEHFPGERLPNLFLVWIEPNHRKSMAAIEQIVTEELERLKHDPITDDELRTVVTKATSDLMYLLDDNMDLAVELGRYEAVAGGWRFLAQYPKRLQRVTAADLKKVSEPFFVDANRVIVERTR